MKGQKPEDSSSELQIHIPRSLSKPLRPLPSRATMNAWVALLEFPVDQLTGGLLLGAHHVKCKADRTCHLLGNQIRGGYFNSEFTNLVER